MKKFLAFFSYSKIVGIKKNPYIKIGKVRVATITRDHDDTPHAISIISVVLAGK